MLFELTYLGRSDKNAVLRAPKYLKDLANRTQLLFSKIKNFVKLCVASFENGSFNLNSSAA